MIVRITKHHLNTPHAHRLAKEFDFVLDDETMHHLEFRCKLPIERYAEWFVQGLEHYRLNPEVIHESRKATRARRNSPPKVVHK